MFGRYAGSEVELLATGGGSNAAATPVFFSALLRKPTQKDLLAGQATIENHAYTFQFLLVCPLALVVDGSKSGQLGIHNTRICRQSMSRWW